MRNPFRNTLGLRGLGRAVGSSPVATATATMAQIATIDTNRVYQRTTTTGGGQGKGTGTIPLTISSASAGTVWARCRGSDGSTIVQPPWQLSNVTNGQTTLNVTGVDARAGWFYVDILTAAGWQLGTTLVGMGRVVAFAGQSLMTRFFGRQDGQTDTYASLGVTVPANGSVLASYSDGNSYTPTVASQAWAAPGDVANGTGFNSVGIGRFLGLQIAMFGVNCGGIGHATGGTSLSTYMTGQSNWTRLSGYISRCGGAIEAMVWGQGHFEAGIRAWDTGYKTGLDLLFAQITAASSRAVARYIWSIPNCAWDDGLGTPKSRNRIRNAAETWAAANSATYIHMDDLRMAEATEGVHETQVGAVTMAEHVHRATRPEAGLSSGVGPALVSATRSGTTLTLTLSDVGQGNLVLSGSAKNRIWVFPAGRFNRNSFNADNRFPVSTVSVVDRTTLSVTMANDPGDGHDLDIYLYWPSGGNGTPYADAIRDDRVDGDGISVGRIVRASTAPIRAAAPVNGGAVNAPPGGFAATASPGPMTGTSTVFAAGRSGFGNEMTGGTATTSTGAEQWPMTAEAFFTCPTIGSVAVIAGFGGYVYVSAAGKLAYSNVLSGGYQTVLTGATTLVAGRRYHVAAQVGPSGMAIYMTDITSASAGVRDAYLASSPTFPPLQAPHQARNITGLFAMSGGAVDEIAIWGIEKYSGASYTAPSAPYTGTEANLMALYHLDETTGATTLAEVVAA